MLHSPSAHPERLVLHQIEWRNEVNENEVDESLSVASSGGTDSSEVSGFDAFHF